MDREGPWTVWKFVLQPGNAVIDMPAGAQLLSVGVLDSETPVLWALCNINAPTVERKIATLVTGHPAPSIDEGRFVGTFVFPNSLVFHVFDCGEAMKS